MSRLGCFGVWIGLFLGLDWAVLASGLGCFWVWIWQFHVYIGLFWCLDWAVLASGSALTSTPPLACLGRILCVFLIRFLYVWTRGCGHGLCPDPAVFMSGLGWFSVWIGLFWGLDWAVFGPGCGHGLCPDPAVFMSGLGWFNVGIGLFWVWIMSGCRSKNNVHMYP